jgi:hypothetical protein
VLRKHSGVTTALDIEDVPVETSGYVGRRVDTDNKIWSFDELCGPDGLGLRLIEISKYVLGTFVNAF